VLESFTFLQLEDDVEIFGKMEQHLITATLFVMLSLIGFLEIGWELLGYTLDFFLWVYCQKCSVWVYWASGQYR
jgi:hypothetical protein